MKVPIYQVDAFTDQLFKGNPAAVCQLEEWPGRQLLHDIAAENNLPETAFFVKKCNQFEIRWFTPEVEVDLCGHGTLSAAHVIFNHTDYQDEMLTFHSNTGELRISKSNGLLTLDFPAMPAEPVAMPDGLAEALGGITPVETLKARDLLAVFKGEEDIIIANPKFDVLHDILKAIDCEGIMVTAPGTKSDFVSRFFAPTVGINEDPVTGSAHTTLTPYWVEKLNKNPLHVYQISRRHGELFCELSEDKKRVFIKGKAVTYLKGEIEV